MYCVSEEEEVKGGSFLKRRRRRASHSLQITNKRKRRKVLLQFKAKFTCTQHRAWVWMLNSVSSFTHLLNLCASFRFGSVLSLQFYILSTILRFSFPLILVHSHSHFSVKIILFRHLSFFRLLCACAALFIAPRFLHTYSKWGRQQCLFKLWH